MIKLNNCRSYIIIGNSAAGISAAKEIRRLDPKGRIDIFSDERTLGYSRVVLPLFIAGKLSWRHMLIGTPSLYSTLDIVLHRNSFVDHVETKSQHIVTADGKRYPFDYLLISTGASPRRLEIPGEEFNGVYYLRNIRDARAIRDFLSSVQGPVLVIGGGPVSLKCAEAILGKEKTVRIVVSSKSLLSQALDETGSSILLEEFKRNGATVHLQTDVTAFQGKHGKIEAAVLSDHTIVPCTLAVIGKGVRPNTGSFRETNISMNRGILVDEHMATNYESIYAAGDVAEYVDALKGTTSVNPIWPLAVEGGRVAGSNMAGMTATFYPAPRMNSFDILGVKIVSVGETKGDEELRLLHGDKGVYQKIVFSEDILSGFLTIGDIRCAGVLTSFVRNRRHVSRSAVESFLERGLSYQLNLAKTSGAIASSEFIVREM